MIAHIGHEKKSLQPIMNLLTAYEQGIALSQYHYAYNMHVYNIPSMSESEAARLGESVVKGLMIKLIV